MLAGQQASGRCSLSSLTFGFGLPEGAQSEKRQLSLGGAGARSPMRLLAARRIGVPVPELAFPAGQRVVPDPVLRSAGPRPPARPPAASLLQGAPSE